MELVLDVMERRDRRQFDPKAEGGSNNAEGKDKEEEEEEEEEPELDEGTARMFEKVERELLEAIR